MGTVSSQCGWDTSWEMGPWCEVREEARGEGGQGQPPRSPGLSREGPEPEGVRVVCFQSSFTDPTALPTPRNITDRPQAFLSQRGDRDLTPGSRTSSGRSQRDHVARVLLPAASSASSSPWRSRCSLRKAHDLSVATSQLHGGPGRGAGGGEQRRRRWNHPRWPIMHCGAYEGPDGGTHV